MAKKVEITFGKDGSIHAEVIGEKGASCEELTAFLDKLFGKPTERKLKDSYYEEKELVKEGLPSGHCG